MPAFYLPYKEPFTNPKTGEITEKWQFALRQINELLAGLTFDNISGQLSLAQLVAHAATHQQGGTDTVKLDDLATPDDTTDLNATVARHGLLPKLSGNAAHTLRGDGTWA